MAYINGFKNSVKTSLICLENEISKSEEEKLRTRIKDNNSLYCALFDSHCVRSDVILCGFLW